MIVRRLFALVTSIAMLHLSLVAGDSVCAAHGTRGHGVSKMSGAATAAHTMPMDGHAMPVGAAAEPAATMASVAKADTPPCETPVQQRCCDAPAGCGAASAVAGARQDLTSATLAAVRISDALHDTPVSIASAPEPPPPKG